MCRLWFLEKVSLARRGAAGQVIRSVRSPRRADGGVAGAQVGRFLTTAAQPAGLLSQAVEQLANSERCEGWCEGLHALVPGRSAGLPCLFRIFQRSSQCEQGAIGEENTSTVKFWARDHAPMRTTARPLQGASGTTDARQKWCYIGQESTVVATTG